MLSDTPCPPLGCPYIYLPFAVAFEQANESRSKGSIEYCVYDRIDRGGDIAQPEAGVDHMLGHLAVGAGGKDDVQYEERRPAEHECEEHQPEHLGGLLLRGDSIGRQTVALGAIVEETV